jgi:hypothetical protein
MFRSCFYIVTALFVGPVLFAADVEVKRAAKATLSRPSGAATPASTRPAPVACGITLPVYYEA